MNRSTEAYSQNPRKIPVKQFIAKITGDVTFLEINSFKNIFEEIGPVATGCFYEHLIFTKNCYSTFQ